MSGSASFSTVEAYVRDAAQQNILNLMVELALELGLEAVLALVLLVALARVLAAGLALHAACNSCSNDIYPVKRTRVPYNLRRH